MPTIRFTLNGQARTVDVRDSGQPLLYALRNECALPGTKFGCGLGQCGACTVHVDDLAVRSCEVTLASAEGRRVTTIEGLGSPDKPHPVQTAFIAEQAAQCGYCTAGMVMTVAALLAKNPKASAAEIRAALAGNLCRCGSHQRVLNAVRRVVERSA